jgi:hypothetical protein
MWAMVAVLCCKPEKPEAQKVKEVAFKYRLAQVRTSMVVVVVILQWWLDLAMVPTTQDPVVPYRLALATPIEVPVVLWHLKGVQEEQEPVVPLCFAVVRVI